MTATIVFDLDGTLVEASPHDAHERNDVQVLARAAPIPNVVRFAHQLRRRGVDVVVATSRPPSVEAATIQCLERCGLWPIKLFQRRLVLFDLASSVRDKVRVIEETGAKLIVGDRDDLEGAAAKVAGVAFLHVRDFHGAGHGGGVDG